MKNRFAVSFLASCAFLLVNQLQAISSESIGANAPHSSSSVGSVVASLGVKPVAYQRSSVTLGSVSQNSVTLGSVKQSTVKQSAVKQSATSDAFQNASASVPAHKAVVNEVAIQGVNSAGSVRMDRSLSIETLFNVAVNGFEVLGLVVGLVLLGKTIKPATGTRRAKYAVSGIILILLSISAPHAANYLVRGGCGSRADLFS
jgi:hypothetical protein